MSSLWDASTGVGDQLIEAIQAEDFELANSLSSEYGRQVAAELQATTTAEGLRNISTAALEQLARALMLARVIRAHLAIRMLSTTRQSAYESASYAGRHWTIEA